MTDQDSISFLKRKIIGVDKLVKNKNKTEAKNADLNEAIELKNRAIVEKDAEIKKLKSELLNRLVASPKKSDAQLSILEKELEETRKMLEDKTIKVSKFREESVSRSQKIGQLEIDLGKRNNKLAVLEKELEKRNGDIVQRELDSLDMKTLVEELQTSKEALEHDLNSGRHIESMKQTYDDLRWKNLAEISSLKQEKAAFEKKLKELTDSNESVSKKSKELAAVIEKSSDRQKDNESLEKQLEKKDKSMVSLEKKLEKALKDNEKLKLRLSKKGISPSGDDSKENAMDRSYESDMEGSDIALTEDETETIPPPRKTFSFSFSKPNARFSICKPSISNQRRVKVKFKKTGSLIENLPVVFNLTPSISDSLPNLTCSEPLLKPIKRKLEDEHLKTPSPKKKLKFSQSVLHELPDSTSPPLMSTLHPVSMSSSYHASAIIQNEPFTLPMVPTPLNQSTPLSFPNSSHRFSLPPTPVGITNPNPTKPRSAHSTKPGIAPLKLAKQQITATSKQHIKPKFEKAKSSSTPKFKMNPPAQLSPIKSPNVKSKQEPSFGSSLESLSAFTSISSVPGTSSASLAAPAVSSAAPTASSAAPATARARILASSLAPQAVEAQVKVAGGKLNLVQLEAAKRRAIPSMTHLPSVNGFRQSANEIKAAGKVITAGVTSGKGSSEKNKSAKLDKKPQSTPEELLYCPSRRRTNPAKVSAAVSTSEISKQSDTSSLSEKSRESAVSGRDVNDISSSSDPLISSAHKPEKSDNKIEIIKSETQSKSQSGSGTKFKSREFISTEESSDDELNNDEETPDASASKKEVLSFDEVSLHSSSQVIGTAEQELTISVKNEQNESLDQKSPIKRSESLDEDLDISDSDDDHREDLGLLIDYPGEERAALESSSTVSMQGDQENSSAVVGNKYQGGSVGESRLKNDVKKQEDKSLDDASDDEDNRSGRFDRLKSESKPLGTSQLQKGQIVLQEVKQEISTAMETSNKTGRKFFSQLEELLFHFQSRTTENMRMLQQERDNLSKERSCFAYAEYVDIIKKHFKNLMGSQNEESFGKIVEGIASNNNPQNEAIVCDLVYEYLKSEHRESPLLNATDENQPAITRKQQRLFILLTTLSKRTRYKNILDRMVNLLWHNLFGRDRMFNLKLNAVQNSGRMFVLCARFTDSVSLMKHVIFDLFYFKSARNHVIVGIVIALWPEIFPHGKSPLSLTPMAETIAWCIFNTGPAQKSPEMLIQETKDNFVREYGFKPNAVKADGLVIKFIKLAEERSNNKELLEEVAMCLLLIGRSKEFRWVNNNISARLLKSLASVWGGADSGDQTVLRWVITTLGLLSRVYPAEGREQVKTLYTSVEQLLKKGSSLQPETELACINALLHLGYHLQYQVAMFLKTWRPSHPLDSSTRSMLENFVGTRGKKFAEITARVQRIEHNKARKRKGLKRKQ